MQLVQSTNEAVLLSPIIKYLECGDIGIHVYNITPPLSKLFLAFTLRKEVKLSRILTNRPSVLYLDDLFLDKYFSFTNSVATLEGPSYNPDQSLFTKILRELINPYLDDCYKLVSYLRNDTFGYASILQQAFGEDRIKATENWMTLDLLGGSIPRICGELKAKIDSNQVEIYSLTRSTDLLDSNNRRSWLKTLHELSPLRDEKGGIVDNETSTRSLSIILGKITIKLYKIGDLFEKDLTRTRYVFARVGNEVVGCAKVFVTEDGMGNIEDVVVRESHRGQGIGQALIFRVLGEGVSLGAKKFRLCCKDDNLKWYQDLGFTKVSNGAYYRLDLPLMN